MSLLNLKNAYTMLCSCMRFSPIMYLLCFFSCCYSPNQVETPVSRRLWCSLLKLQFTKESESLITVEMLASTALCEIIYLIFRGQPLLILGVVEPTLIMYSNLYNFAKGRSDLGRELYLAWAGWVCVWTALLLFLLTIFNACTIITRFTRIARQFFGMLTAVLFDQEAFKGLISKYNIPKTENPALEKYQSQWLYTDGLLTIIFAIGLLLTALKSRKIRVLPDRAYAVS